MTIDVSVVMCAYNEERSLERSVESALSQQGVALEIILVNDNSTDGTLNLMQSLAKEDARITIIDNKENLGPAACRNRAEQSAVGEWICPLDADDWFGEGRLTRLVEEGRRHKVDMVSDDLYFVSEGHEYKLKRLLPKKYKDVCTLVTVDKFIKMRMPLGLCWGYMQPLVRTSFLRMNDIKYNENLRIMEDWDYYMKCLLHGASFLLVGEPYYYYWVTQNSLSKAGSDKSRMRIGIEINKNIMQLAMEKKNLSAILMLKKRERLLKRMVLYYDLSAALKSLKLSDAIKVLKRDPGALPFHTTLGFRSFTDRVASLLGIQSLEL